MSPNKTPLWLWPNLLSLDAPLVAVAWLYMFAEAWRVNFLHWQAYLALGLGVWMIYVVDRLVDLKVKGEDDPTLGARHAFHRRHRTWFVAGLVAAAAWVLWLIFQVLPAELILSYSPLGLALVAAFFALVMFSPPSGEIPHFRNIVAGLAFGYGTAMMAHIYAPSAGVFDMIVGTREMLSFAVLCIMNISAIHLWEHARLSDDPEVKAADEMSLTLPLTLLGGFAVYFAYSDNSALFGQNADVAEAGARPFFYAILISSALLYVINRSRSRFSLDALRCMADLAMVAPLPLFLILSQGG